MLDRRSRLVGVGLVLASLTGGCGGGEPDKTTVRGIFTLQDEEGFTGSWNSCSGDGGYSDFGPGMNVTIRDGAGEIVGTGSTRSLTEAETLGDLDDPDSTIPGDADAMQLAGTFAKTLGYCAVAFETEVNDAEFYEIEVGRRGSLTYSADELREREYFVELSLGG